MENISRRYLNKLCGEITQRPVGSEGNRQATDFFKQVVASFGWNIESTSFQAMDWMDDGAEFHVEGRSYQVFPSPYAEGCSIKAPLVSAASLKELGCLDAEHKLLLLHGDLAKEQLMPKNFVFYNPDEHREIIALLEQKNPAGILTATGRNPSLAGGVYPFPLIEDGDFDIPSVYLTEEEGTRMLRDVGRFGSLISRAKRVRSQADHLVARKGADLDRRVAISAHIDAKPGTPGAIDNGTGVVILMLLAELLKDWDGYTLELLPFNGEDNYAAPGQMLYLKMNQDLSDRVLININIDGAGYKIGPSAFSPLNLPESIKANLDLVLASSDSLIEGTPWYQGDHSIFLQQGIPAIAVSSAWFVENVDIQEITHTPADHPDIVDHGKVIEIAMAIYQFILRTYLR